MKNSKKTTYNAIDLSKLSKDMFSGGRTWAAVEFAINCANELMELNSKGNTILFDDDIVDKVEFELKIYDWCDAPHGCYLYRSLWKNTQEIVFGDNVNKDGRLVLTKEEVREYFSRFKIFRSVMYLSNSIKKLKG
ncbi:hypothetical protein fnug_5 [Pseudomonas phage fnug]|uniref:PHIKZ005 n=2 Tax=Phikzvirus phiKZ TaxID=169683 RepID=Q8SDF7_BPDPK|nr:PHIKZ005 [Pseudomonas phage phiKZ]QJB22648.1 hypothetical protein fnug_5 [Pseudomonas phage fnug]QYV99125.1 hypothetical protein [Pseudomonas phage T2P]QYV99170.1 hypothetical protein [Pseudomonas phage U1B]QYV99625.1 u-spanin [Pseudomonas phage U5]UXD83678.1 hypothetical protein NP274_00271 [Pseudomonas phage Koomba boorn-mokiny kep-wari Wadjak 2]WNV50380.1 hypothetical protein [Pseudomonas phage PhiPizzaParty]WPJ69128.1 hypothetical protein PAZH1_05 [Pseudomonas phage PA_ZH1]WRQ05888.1